MAALMTLDGAKQGAVFLAYVEQGLIPTLRPGDIAVMDNLQTHKVPAARLAIEAAVVPVSCSLFSYGREFNSVETAFSKIETHLRRVAARTLPHL